MLDTTGRTAMRLLPQGQLQSQFGGTVSSPVAASFGREIVTAGCSVGIPLLFSAITIAADEVRCSLV